MGGMYLIYFVQSRGSAGWSAPLHIVVLRHVVSLQVSSDFSFFEACASVVVYKRDSSVLLQDLISGKYRRRYLGFVHV